MMKLQYRHASYPYVVRKQSLRNWGVYDQQGNLIEGGFFYAAAAQECAHRYNRNADRKIVL